MLAGFAGILAVGFAVWAGKAISVGHAVSLCAGAVLIVLPLAASFEFTGDGVKFTRSSETLNLVSQVEALTEQNTGLRTDLQKTISGLQAATERLKAIETSAQSSGGVLPLPTPSQEWQNVIVPTFFEDLKANNQQGLRDADETLKSLEQLKGQLRGDGLPEFYLRED
jgi:hypothetical protein